MCCVNYTFRGKHVCIAGPILYTSPYYFLALRKKLEKVAKEKDCELVSEWMKSIINHLYW